MNNAWFDGRFGAVLSTYPGQIRTLLDQHFKVCKDWTDRGVIGVSGHPVLRGWPIGTRGIVVGLLYSNNRGWEVRLEHEHFQPNWDENWPEIPLQLFLAFTAPTEPYSTPCVNLQAANEE